MTLTGQQIREARALLGLQRSELAARVRGVTTATIVRAESVDGAADHDRAGRYDQTNARDGRR